MNSPAQSRKPQTILALDIGGTGLKAALIDADGHMLSERLRVETPYPCPPPTLVEALVALVQPVADYDGIAIGFPGVVRGDYVLTAPHFGNREWSGFALAQALSERLGGRPARMINDAEMQGMAVISGIGLELVLTLGTGIGTGLFRDGVLMPHLELAQHPLRRKQTYNDYLGNQTLKKIGAKRWNRRVGKTVAVLQSLLHYDRLFIGGGNARLISPELLAKLRGRAWAASVPRASADDSANAVSIVSNDAGLEGGAALWRTA